MTENGLPSKKEEVNTKYCYTQEVRITKGFHKGFKGKIIDFFVVDDEIFYNVKLEDNNKPITLKEGSVRPLSFFDKWL